MLHASVRTATQQNQLAKPLRDAVRRTRYKGMRASLRRLPISGEPYPAANHLNLDYTVTQAASQVRLSFPNSPPGVSNSRIVAKQRNVLQLLCSEVNAKLAEAITTRTEPML